VLAAALLLAALGLLGLALTCVVVRVATTAVANFAVAIATAAGFRRAFAAGRRGLATLGIRLLLAFGGTGPERCTAAFASLRAALRRVAGISRRSRGAGIGRCSCHRRAGVAVAVAAVLLDDGDEFALAHARGALDTHFTGQSAQIGEQHRRQRAGTATAGDACARRCFA
jgi:hypothetical protein